MLQVGATLLLSWMSRVWLAGELSLQREGSAALRLFQAPDKGKTRWVAVPRQGDSYYVLEADAEGRRIRVSKKAIAEQQEKAELREYASRQEAQASPSLGTLADKLRGALSTRK